MKVLCRSGSVYRDLRDDNADVKQFKALRVVEIIKTLDRIRLSARQAHVRTDVAVAPAPRRGTPCDLTGQGWSSGSFIQP